MLREPRIVKHPSLNIQLRNNPLCATRHDQPGIPRRVGQELLHRLGGTDDDHRRVSDVRARTTQATARLNPIERPHNPEPFIWTATGDQILEKVRRGRVSLAAITTRSAAVVGDVEGVSAHASRQHAAFDFIDGSFGQRC